MLTQRQQIATQLQFKNQADFKMLDFVSCTMQRTKEIPTCMTKVERSRLLVRHVKKEIVDICKKKHYLESE